MATLRDLKRRIRSVESTRKITKAMEMVAAAKLRKAQHHLGASRPYADKMNEVLSLLASAPGAESHPFFERRESDRLSVLLVTSDRGLCGAFNTNLSRTAEAELARGTASGEKRPKLSVVGRKGNQYFRHRQVAIADSFENLGDQVDFQMVQTITRAAVDPFLKKEVDRVVIVSTKFISAARREVVVRPFLPIDRGDADRASTRDYIYEPSQAEIFDQLLPRYTQALFYSILAESFAAEHSARMLAMGNATRNAGEMIDDLTRLRNRLRQAAITAELADIGGAVEALS